MNIHLPDHDAKLLVASAVQARARASRHWIWMKMRDEISSFAGRHTEHECESNNMRTEINNKSLLALSHVFSQVRRVAHALLVREREYASVCERATVCVCVWACSCLSSTYLWLHYLPAAAFTVPYLKYTKNTHTHTAVCLCVCSWTSERINDI